MSWVCVWGILFSLYREGAFDLNVCECREREREREGVCVIEESESVEFHGVLLPEE